MVSAYEFTQPPAIPQGLGVMVEHPPTWDANRSATAFGDLLEISVRQGILLLPSIGVFGRSGNVTASATRAPPSLAPRAGVLSTFPRAGRATPKTRGPRRPESRAPPTDRRPPRPAQAGPPRPSHLGNPLARRPPTSGRSAVEVAHAQVGISNARDHQPAFPADVVGLACPFATPHWRGQEVLRLACMG